MKAHGKLFEVSRTVWKLYSAVIMCFFAAVFLVHIPVYADEYKTIRVGYYQADGFLEEGSRTEQRSGYGYEYLQKIASYTGWKYEYVDGTWEELYKKLTNGEIDLLAGVAYDEARSDEVAYPDYEMLKETFYIYKDSNDSSMQGGNIASFAGKKIGVAVSPKMEKIINEWKDKNDADITIEIFEDLASCADAFNTHQIDGFVSADNIVSGYTGISPVELIGKVPYYICTAKGEDDILESLNSALALINGQDSLFLVNLKNKYCADTSISIFLTKQEKDWMNAHPVITVGYLNHYLPYSNTAQDGSAEGVIVDALADLFASLPGNYAPEIAYVSYENQGDMIRAMKNHEVDMVFPVGGDLLYAEQNGYQQSSVLMKAAVDLVYAEPYDASKTNRIAVNRNNILQKEYSEINYPQAELVECDSAEACIRAVRNGQADSSLIEAIRAVKLVGEDKKLQILPLAATCDICFGVDYGSSDLLCVLNHGLSMLGDEYGLSHAYKYMGDIMSYNVDDFLRKNVWVIYILAALMAVFLIIIVYIRYRSMKKISKVEAQHNQILQNALMQAHEADYTKQIFLNNMSHDIRTPLNAILGIIEINQKCKDPEKILENQKKAVGCVNQLLAMFDNMIEMSKLENGQLLDMKEQVNLLQLINSLERNVQRQSAEKGLELIHKIETDAEKWPTVYGNHSCIQEALHHVLSNAVKYNHKGGQIVWKDQIKYIAKEKVLYSCMVSDTGMGIKEDFLKHIFEPFAQERYDARTTYQGSGLGLAIAKALLDQMNGTINISSKEGKGTTVCIQIPMQIFTETSEKKFPDGEKTLQLEEESQNLAGAKILLVEDNELNIEIAQFMLEESGAGVTVARDGAQAVEAYLQEAPWTYDAIIMDIMMPVMDGYEAAEKIRAAGKKDSKIIPIIAATACAADDFRKEGESAGFSAFLTKPLDMNKMMQTVYHLMKHTHPKDNFVGSDLENR